MPAPRDFHSFPLTRQSAVAAARSEDPAQRRAGHEQLARAYWSPCQAYARARWRLAPADAEELVQGFFARSFEEGFFARYEAQRGRFRSFLRGCLELHARKQREELSRKGRGARLDELAEPSDAAREEQREALFQREWQRHVLEQAIERLRAHCREAGKLDALALFERYDLHDPARGERPGYAELAREFQLAETTVTNRLHWARTTLREFALDELARAAGSEDEWHADARALFEERDP